MQKSFKYREHAKAFDLTAIKIFCSAIAISLAGMASEASTPTSQSEDLAAQVITKAKDELKSCPVPYSAEYCTKESKQNYCEPQRTSWVDTLSLYSKQHLGVTPVCSPTRIGGRQNES